MSSGLVERLRVLRNIVVDAINSIEYELQDIESKLDRFRGVYRVAFDLNVVKGYCYVRMRLIGWDGRTVKSLNIGRIDRIGSPDELRQLILSRLNNGLSPEDILNIRSLHERRRILSYLRSRLMYLLNDIDETLKSYEEPRDYESILLQLKERARYKGVIE